MVWGAKIPSMGMFRVGGTNPYPCKCRGLRGVRQDPWRGPFPLIHKDAGRLVGSKNWDPPGCGGVSGSRDAPFHVSRERGGGKGGGKGGGGGKQPKAPSDTSGAGEGTAEPVAPGALTHYPRLGAPERRLPAGPGASQPLCCWKRGKDGKTIPKIAPAARPHGQRGATGTAAQGGYRSHHWGARQAASGTLWSPAWGDHPSEHPPRMQAPEWGHRGTGDPGLGVGVMGVLWFGVQPGCSWVLGVQG